MKFSVFCPAMLFAVSALLDSQILVQAVKIASTVSKDSNVAMPSAANDVLSLAQWDSASPMGPNDLTVGEQGD